MENEKENETVNESKNDEKIEGNFLSNVFKKSIPAAGLLVGSVLLIFGLYVMEKNQLINLGIYSMDTAVAMSTITFSTLGIVFLYKVCSPLSKYRKIVVLVSAIANAVVLLVTAIISYAMNMNKPEPLLKIPYYEMSGPAYLTTAIIIVVFAAIYLFVYKIIEICNEGEKKENEN